MDKLPTHLAVAHDLTAAIIARGENNAKEIAWAFALFAHIVQLCESNPAQALAEAERLNRCSDSEGFPMPPPP